MKIKTHTLTILATLSTLSPVMAQIETGDSIQISINGVPSEEQGKVNALYPVSSNGMINLPFIGVVRAAGMKPETLAMKIQRSYKNAEIYTNPTIQVISNTGDAGVKDEIVHIGGQVRGPGPKGFRRGLTIYQAIQSAGGATEFGSMKRVKLYRDGKTRILNLKKAENMRIKVRPNDTIEIPQKNLWGQ